MFSIVMATTRLRRTDPTFEDENGGDDLSNDLDEEGE